MPPVQPDPEPFEDAAFASAQSSAHGRVGHVSAGPAAPPSPGSAPRAPGRIGPSSRPARICTGDPCVRHGACPNCGVIGRVRGPQKAPVHQPFLSFNGPSSTPDLQRFSQFRTISAPIFEVQFTPGRRRAADSRHSGERGLPCAASCPCRFGISPRASPGTPVAGIPQRCAHGGAAPSGLGQSAITSLAMV